MKELIDEIMSYSSRNILNQLINTCNTDVQLKILRNLRSEHSQDIYNECELGVDLLTFMRNINFFSDNNDFNNSTFPFKCNLCNRLLTSEQKNHHFRCCTVLTQTIKDCYNLEEAKLYLLTQYRINFNDKGVGKSRNRK